MTASTVGPRPPLRQIERQRQERHEQVWRARFARHALGCRDCDPVWPCDFIRRAASIDGVDLWVEHPDAP